jgi:hypothetical protein
MEKVFDAALIADKAEAFVDEKSCNGTGWHTEASVPPPSKWMSWVSRPV